MIKMGCQDVHSTSLQKAFKMKVIDIHTHGIGGYDTRSTKESEILKIAEIFGSHGISEIILTIYPSSIKVMRENMMTVRKAMEKQRDISNPPLPHDNPPSPPFSKGGMGGFDKGGWVRERVRTLNSKLRTPNSALILGIHLEGPFLNPSKCGALNARTFIEATEYNFKELIEGFEDIVKIITVAPEIKRATRLIKKISDRGIIVSMGHSDATFSEAEAGFNAGATGVTHIFNAMRGFHHREPGIAGFGIINKDIYIEVIADPFHLYPKTLELIFNTKNPEKIIIVSDSVKETYSPPTPPYRGRVKGRVKKKDRVKAVTDTKGKLLGGSMTIVESSRRLIQMGFDEDIIMRCITTNPRRYLQSLSL
jgi:N-acetylglucosamine-6-phosphate deacetylase